MSNNAADTYLRTKVLTATPEQLQMMLYDGAIRFAEQAGLAIGVKDFEKSHDLLSRAQKIVLEMQCGLKRSVSPDLCDKLSALYTFVHRRLVEANTKHELPLLEEALQILRYQRETWAMLMQKLAQGKAAKMAMKLDMPAPDARMEASISLRG
ncbi:MAG: fliS [Phycisphaerales bacterium]|nr:fliS [Phycisphaerales bacterium]